MSSVTRLNDSGTQGQPAAGLAFAKPSGGGLQAVSVASTGTQLRVSDWTFTSAGAVTLASSVTRNDAVSQFDAALIASPVVAGYRNASSGDLHVASFTGLNTQDVLRGAIDDRRLAVVRRSFNNDWFVAFAGTDGDLHVQFWQLTGSGANPLPAFVSGSGDQAGAASHIAGTWAAGNLISAVRTGGNLKLIAWGLGAQNALQRLGDSGGQGAAAIDDLCVTGFSSLDSVAAHFVVTAVKNSAGNLELTSWRVNTDGSLTKLSTVVSSAVGELAITPFQQVVAANLGVFVTAVTDAAGNLVVTSWRVLSTGTIQQLATAGAGAASNVAIIDVATDMVATTCTTGSGLEKVISWRIA